MFIVLFVIDGACLLIVTYSNVETNPNAQRLMKSYKFIDTVSVVLV